MLEKCDVISQPPDAAVPQETKQTRLLCETPGGRWRYMTGLTSTVIFHNGSENVLFSHEKVVHYNLKRDLSPAFRTHGRTSTRAKGYKRKKSDVCCIFIRPGLVFLHTAAPLTLSSLLTVEKGCGLMALLAFLQTLDSNMAVGRRPEEGQRPRGSGGEAIKILKRQKLQCVSQHTFDFAKRFRVRCVLFEQSRW